MSKKSSSKNATPDSNVAGDPRNGEPRSISPSSKPNWLRRRVQYLWAFFLQPSTIVPALRNGIAELWASHGGGYYGFGYVLAFIYLEAALLAEDVADSEGVAEFVANEALETLFRVGVMSFVNGLLALLWPLMLIDRMQWVGVAIIGGAYLLFEHFIRPSIEHRFPELRATTDQREVQRASRRQNRKNKRWWSLNRKKTSKDHADDT